MSQWPSLCRHTRIQRSPRVLHIVPAPFGSDGGYFGGAERYVFELARHMSQEVPTTLVSFGPEQRQTVLGRLRIRVLGKPWYVRGQRSNPLHAGLGPFLAAADVVHCHQQHVLCSSLTALVCRLSGRQVFVSDMGGGAWDLSAYVSTDRWFHGHLHISEYSRKVFGHDGSSKAHVILGGVDAEKFAPDPAAPRDGAVLFVGRLLPHEGVNVLIDAVPP